MSYDNYFVRLRIAQEYDTVALRRDALKRAGIITPLAPGADEEGYYRIPIIERRKEGKVVTGYRHVAYYLEGEKLIGLVDNRYMSQNEVDELWSWCAFHPIPEEWYREREYDRPWPDLRAYQDQLAPMADSPPRDHNSPPELLPHEQFAQDIASAVGAAPASVSSEQEAATALGSRNRIAELRLAAEKLRKEEVEPHVRAQAKINAIWQPVIHTATTAEKALKEIVLLYRERERQRVVAELAEANEKQRELDEANARAADRAIANGEAEQPPEVVEVEQPSPLAPVLPLYGKRKLKEQVSWHFDAVTDWDALYQHFKNHDGVRALLTTLATAEIKLGRDVPGTRKHEGLI